MFLVIEGDNGTGKDTLAQKISVHGYEIVSYNKNIKIEETKAKKLLGEERVAAFYNYNMLCGKIAQQEKKSTIIIRYWISTLAANYADNKSTKESFIKSVTENENKFSKPDYVICLNCSFKERIARINQRNNGQLDDKTIQRSNNYREALKLIQTHTTLNWYDVDTTAKTPDEICALVLKHINR